MIWDIEKPCATCPYRRETKLRLWDIFEFQRLLKQDTNPVHGSTFGCHMYRTKPKEEHRPCVGWLLDQKKRGEPSIQLRLILMGNESARALYKHISRKGLRLYKSIEAMCRANYPEHEWNRPFAIGDRVLVCADDSPGQITGWNERYKTWDILLDSGARTTTREDNIRHG
jgi:hypothetical protein